MKKVFTMICCLILSLSIILEIGYVSLSNAITENKVKESVKQNLLTGFIYDKNGNKTEIFNSFNIKKYFASIEDFAKETKVKFEYMINKELVFFRFFDNEILTKPITNDKETKEYMYKYYRIIEFMSEFIEKIVN